MIAAVRVWVSGCWPPRPIGKPGCSPPPRTRGHEKRHDAITATTTSASRRDCRTGLAIRAPDEVRAAPMFHEDGAHLKQLQAGCFLPWI